MISSNTIEIKSPTRREIEEESKIIDEDENVKTISKDNIKIAGGNKKMKIKFQEPAVRSSNANGDGRF